jgi:geranylgeranyl diphosphate synthase type I
VDVSSLRERVQHELDVVLAHQRSLLAEVDPACLPLVEAVADLAAGGKRLRAAFCYWGWRAAGADDDDLVVRVGAALELFQAAALLHDDLIDGSDTRRGRPSAHRRFAALHREQGWEGDPEGFGAAGAVLAGDLCLAWSTELLAQASACLPESRRAAGRAVFERMSTQLMGGQFLDVVVQARPADGAEEQLEQARQVIRWKTVHYTVEHPLHLGIRLAGGPDALTETASRYAAAVGEAFQLRDDVLGVFGDPRVTGKPSGDDLREGKRTVLLALAQREADPVQRELLARSVGDPSLDAGGVQALREVITGTGALDEVERRIDRLAQQAREVLRDADLPPAAARALDELVTTATRRTS